MQPPKLILDAGCGKGRYSAELASSGFTVTGVDQSPELIGVARDRLPVSGGGARYEISNLLEFEPPAPCDAVLCRGVLNDFTNDADRRLIFERFADWLAPRGALILDVRDWDASASRYTKQPIATRHVAVKDGSELTFESYTVPNHSMRELRVRETFQHRDGDKVTKTENEFVMRCWSRAELQQMLASRFGDVSIHSSYGETDSVWSDRLVVVASLT